MYSYDRGLNKSWNMSQYKTPRIYQDAALEVQKRKWATQKKGQKTNKYVTKRGFYMDYDLKVSKSIPGSSNSWIMQMCIKVNNLGHSKNSLKNQSIGKSIQNYKKIPISNKYNINNKNARNLESGPIVYKNLSKNKFRVYLN